MTEPKIDDEALDAIVKEIHEHYPTDIQRTVALLNDNTLKHWLYQAFWAGFNRGEFIAKRHPQK
jgi:hypothetical protein